MSVNTSFEKFAGIATRVTGSSGAFVAALFLVVSWMATGPIFHYSENWQLFINTGTTIITFLMVFIIQKSQNKESLAMQLKLNELVAAHEHASNRVMSVEDLGEKEMKVLRDFYTKLSELSKNDDELRQSHSIEEAMENHEEKLGNLKD
ncbi:MAG: low affinity iron permease family protein [Opitutaceae bacterium]|nr:low affinity iron permease family protein [Cytophagales bacterium]